MFSVTIFCSLLVFSFATSEESTLPADEVRTLNDWFKINRVIGGTKASPGEFPHQISLQYGFPPYMPLSHICGGSIIGKSWILTAAHCVYDLPQGGQLFVLAGKNQIKLNEQTQQYGEIENIIVHRSYRGGVAPYDIALIKLSNSLQFNDYVRPINLPIANSIPSGNAILTGWGSTSQAATPVLPNTLQKVTLPIINLATCRQAMRMMGESAGVHDTNVCTGPLTGGYSPCNGDSGGPLILDNRSIDERELVGIVSWGLIPCGRYGAAAVFVRVSAFIDWISEVTETHGGL